MGGRQFVWFGWHWQFLPLIRAISFDQYIGGKYVLTNILGGNTWISQMPLLLCFAAATFAFPWQLQLLPPLQFNSLPDSSTSFPLSKLLPHQSSCHFVFLWENEKEKQLQWNLESSGQLHWYSRLEFGESEHGNPLLHIGHWYSNAPQDKNNGGIESTWKISPAVTTKHEFSIRLWPTFIWKQLGQALDNLDSQNDDELNWAKFLQLLAACHIWIVEPWMSD